MMEEKDEVIKALEFIKNNIVEDNDENVRIEKIEEFIQKA